jgi:hypothetical protein
VIYINSIIFGQGYVASTLNVGLQRIKDGKIGLEGIPLGNSIFKIVEDIKIVKNRGSIRFRQEKDRKNLGEITKDYCDRNIKFDDDYIIEEGYRDNRKGESIDLKEELESMSVMSIGIGLLLVEEFPMAIPAFTLIGLGIDILITFLNLKKNKIQNKTGQK